jgi:outer membrane lipoprotein-sorting protein
MSNRFKRLILFCVISVIAVSAATAEQSAQEIVRRLEANRNHGTSRAESTMTIQDRFGQRNTRMIAYNRGNNDALIEFTSAAERGQKVLRTGNEIYLFYPDAAELIRLQGSALRESMLGSDVSYEDLTGGRTLLDDYTVTLDGTERIDGRRTWRVQFEARRRNVAYPRQTMWIDQEWYVPLRAEQRALNGRLLKEIRSEDIQQVSGRWIPHRMIISDVLKRDSTTTVEIQRIEIGIPLDTQIFSLEELSW